MGGLEMKKIAVLSAVLLAAVSCYDPYIKDYDFNAVYVAYQYDLRTFVVGEGMKFRLTAGLGGVLENDRDRKVDFEIDPQLVTGKLNWYWPGVTEDVTAFSEMSGKTSYGKISQSYVTEALAASGISELQPLPRSVYYLSDDSIVINEGRMTGSVTVEADSLAFLSLPQAAGRTRYAIGFKIVSADADSVLRQKAYQVCAVRYENMFFGYWYHGGETTVVDSGGNVVETRSYPLRIPSDPSTSEVYTLSTCAPNAVTTNYMGDGEGSLKLVYDGGSVKVSSNDPTRKVVDMESTFNRASLLQDRKLFLNYRYENPDGSTSIVKDTLAFRNRIRDGVNEWQDSNISHYEKQ